MNTRLQEIIKYKTGGHQAEFAQLMEWTPPYLAKLLRGENFGLKPILKILEVLPEINARWLLFGSGGMIENSKLNELQREFFSSVQAILNIEKFIPVMTSDELHEYERCITSGERVNFSNEILREWEERLSKKNATLTERITEAKAKSLSDANKR